MRVFHPVLLLVIVPFLLTACHHDGQAQRDTIRVTGVADVKAVPNQFVVHAAASLEGDDIGALSDRVNQQINGVFDLADELGIPEDHIKALSLQVSPRWSYKPKRHLAGYQVQRDITIVLDGMEHYGQLLEGLVDIGINHISRTQARVADSKALLQKALVQAIKNARKKADIMAEAAGRDIGKAIAIQQQSTHRPSPRIMMRAATLKADSAHYSPGKTTLSQQVSVTFTLE